MCVCVCLPLSGAVAVRPGSEGGSRVSRRLLTLFLSSISSLRRYFTWLDSKGRGWPFTGGEEETEKGNTNGLLQEGNVEASNYSSMWWLSPSAPLTNTALIFKDNRFMNHRLSPVRASRKGWSNMILYSQRLYGITKITSYHTHDIVHFYKLKKVKTFKIKLRFDIILCLLLMEKDTTC